MSSATSVIAYVVERPSSLVLTVVGAGIAVNLGTLVTHALYLILQMLGKVLTSLFWVAVIGGWVWFAKRHFV
ncbi:hypothetical protein BJ741DRAFT_607117 [Chytriomyces cf. hyalinus JEL632]|nr:hypothetical protein BJ741DRAFT_607117 [Chytriomyces cf. hyalinus JEL632]